MWHPFNLSPLHTHVYTCIHSPTSTDAKTCTKAYTIHTGIIHTYYAHTYYSYIYITYIYSTLIHHIHTHTIPNSIFNDLVNNLPVYFIQIVLKRLNLKVKPLSLSSAKIQAHYSLDCQPAQRALSLGWTECGWSWAVPREMDNCEVWWKCEHLCVLEENFWDVLGEQANWEALPLGIQ